ncbi:MAG: outer membrane protein transport protein [Nitrospirae bacterium]|nr:outer membrane protein transport protein [Nitrospirota bacterium]
MRVASLRLAGLFAFAWAVCSAPTDAVASGFYVTQIGGPDSGPTEPAPTAVFWNPAALGGDRVPAAMLDLTYFMRKAEYSRSHEFTQDASKDWIAIPSSSSQTGNLSNWLPFPFAGASWPLSRGVGGIGVYAPFGATSEWDDPHGAQKYYAGTSTLMHVFVTPAYAHPLTDRAHIGFGFSYVRSFLDTTRHSDIASSLAGGRPEAPDTDAITHLDNVAGNAFNGTLGVFLDHEAWQFGASFSTPTVVKGHGVFEFIPLGRFLCTRVGCRTDDGGRLEEAVTPADIERIVPYKAEVRAEYTLPASVKAAFDYHVTPRIRTRVYGEWVNWKAFETITLRTSERQNNLIPETQTIEERFEDAFGIRLNVKYRWSDRIAPFAGVSFDGNAVPDAWLTPAIIDSDKVTGLAGGDFAITDRIRAKAAVGRIFYGDRKIDLGESLQEPTSAGSYENSVTFFNLNLAYRFAPGGASPVEPANPEVP